MPHQSALTETETTEAVTSIISAILELLSTAERNQLTQVSIHLNSALVALGYPGVPPTGPWIQDLSVATEAQRRSEGTAAEQGAKESRL